MLRSLFGRKKRDKPAAPADDSIRSARVDDVLFVPAMWDDGEDAYLIVQQISRLESAYGESRELVGVEGDRRATIEWSEDHDGSLHISLVRNDAPLGLSAIGLDYDTLVEWDTDKSLENRIEYGGSRYFYRNSYEAMYHRGDEREGFYVWEFPREDEGGAITIVKWEGLPFEVYESIVLSPHLVTVYHK